MTEVKDHLKEYFDKRPSEIASMQAKAVQDYNYTVGALSEHQFIKKVMEMEANRVSMSDLLAKDAAEKEIWDKQQVETALKAEKPAVIEEKTPPVS